MIASKEIQKNPLIEVFRHLIADIQAISEGECQQAIADIDQNCQNQRVQIRYSVRRLIPENNDLERLVDGGLKR
jgi:hypothetical protein